jgi:hypothetical protein
VPAGLSELGVLLDVSADGTAASQSTVMFVPPGVPPTFADLEAVTTVLAGELVGGCAGSNSV